MTEKLNSFVEFSQKFLFNRHSFVLKGQVSHEKTLLLSILLGV